MYESVGGGSYSCSFRRESILHDNFSVLQVSTGRETSKLIVLCKSLDQYRNGGERGQGRFIQDLGLRELQTASVFRTRFNSPVLLCVDDEMHRAHT